MNFLTVIIARIKIPPSTSVTFRFWSQTGAVIRRVILTQSHRKYSFLGSVLAPAQIQYHVSVVCQSLSSPVYSGPLEQAFGSLSGSGFAAGSGHICSDVIPFDSLDQLSVGSVSCNRYCRGIFSLQQV